MRKFDVRSHVTLELYEIGVYFNKNIVKLNDSGSRNAAVIITSHKMKIF